MLKKIGMMVVSICFALSCIGEMSETRRVTVNGIEWLYTIDETDKDVKSIVLEKAILLTADQYEMTINVADIISEIAPYTDERNEYFGCDWIVKIGASAFEGNEYLTKITIQDGYWREFTSNKIYLTICTKAFKDCPNFQGVFCEEMYDNMYPRGRFILQSIEDSAFENCGINCSDSFQLFSNGSSSSITAHELMSTVTNIGARAFYGVRGATSWEHFYDNGVRTEDMVVGVSLDSLKYLGEEAFAKSTVFGRIKLPSSLKTIKYSTFQEYSGEVCFSSGLEEIEEFAFLNCEFLQYIDQGNRLSCQVGSVLLPNSVMKVGVQAFDSAIYEGLTLPEKLKYIGHWAFKGGDQGTSYASQLKGTLVIPKSVEFIGQSAFWNHPYLESIRFEGLPPNGMFNSDISESREVLVLLEHKEQWTPYMRGNMKFAKKVNGEWVALGGKVISNAMRPSDPTIMDIKYKVTSTKDKVNVRMLAFEDGNRSFAKVLRPETFLDGTEANVGDGVAANVEHTVSWQVSKDWDVDLAKVSIEVYVQEDNLLPLSLTTIPAMGERASVTFSRNVPNEEKVMNALYWLYADKAADLTLANGVLKCGNTQLVNGSSLSAANAVSYIYSKMGYGTLSGDTLNYVNGLTRLGLSPSGIKQYAVKEGAAE
ncbi:MAG: leucine-rich repeat protein [Kiritimatiellae bacterium]|nr:leucine-rich repeat protein [Kiritimatiellia bacterium]